MRMVIIGLMPPPKKKRLTHNKNPAPRPIPNRPRSGNFLSNTEQKKTANGAKRAGGLWGTGQDSNLWPFDSQTIFDLYKWEARRKNHWSRRADRWCFFFAVSGLWQVLWQIGGSKNLYGIRVKRLLFNVVCGRICGKTGEKPKIT